MKLNTTAPTLFDTPGPGAYKPTSYTLKSFPTIGFKSEQRDRTAANRDTPGPAAYLPNVSLVKEHFAEVKIGTGERPKPINSENPAPGDYQYRSLFDDNKKDGKGPTLSTRYQKLTFVDENPGPGEYSQNVGPIKVRPMSCK